MKQNIPNSPFTTHLSGSARETELRLRNIFQWKKKRPPVVLFVLVAVLLLGLCGGLVGFTTLGPEESPADDLVVSPTQTVEQTSRPGPSERPESTDDPAPVGTPEPQGPVNTQASLNWREGYKAILRDWTVIEDYGDLSYPQFYFAENYGFDHYYLYDVDGNGTPELFLASAAMGLTSVLTYTDQPVFLLYDDLYGFNPETSEIIIRGHWHGAGGSGTREWWGYRLSDATVELTLYIDQMPSSYSIYDPQTDEWDFFGSQAKYEELYATHVTQVIPVEHFRFYELDDFSGLEGPAAPSGASYYPLRTADGRVLTLALDETEVADREGCYSVDEIRVYSGSTLLQTTQTADLTYKGDYLYEGLFVIKGKDAWDDPNFSDYNFDGSADLKLLASNHFPKNIPYAFFLWNDRTQRLEFSFVLANSVVPDRSEQELREWISDGPSIIRRYYRYDGNGQLYLDRSEQISAG